MLNSELVSMVGAGHTDARRTWVTARVSGLDSGTRYGIYSLYVVPVIPRSCMMCDELVPGEVDGDKRPANVMTRAHSTAPTPTLHVQPV